MQRVEQAINQGEEIDADIVRRYRLERFEDPQDKLEFMKAELIRYLNKKDCIKVYEENFLEANIKTSMKQLFGKKKYLKDGKEGKTIEFPSIIRMHTDADLVDNWVNYSCLDAEVTFFVHRVLTNELSALKTNFEDMKNNLDIYNKYWLPFGEILTDMERRGFELNLDHLEVLYIRMNLFFPIPILRKSKEKRLMICVVLKKNLWTGYARLRRELNSLIPPRHNSFNNSSSLRSRSQREGQKRRPMIGIYQIHREKTSCMISRRWRRRIRCPVLKIKETMRNPLTKMEARSQIAKKWMNYPRLRSSKFSTSMYSLQIYKTDLRWMIFCL